MDKVYEIISEPISESLKQIGVNISKEFVLIILVLIGIVATYLLRKGSSHISKIRAKKKSKSLHPFFSYNEINSAKNNYVRQNFQNIAPSKEDELVYAHSSVAKQKLIKFFLDSFSDRSNKRFFILLADSGMGKTTFSLNLYSKYNSFWRYLFKKNKYDISLVPLGYDNADHHINESKKNNAHLDTILILDALDEDSSAVVDSKKRMKELIELTKEFRFVILTCRTQFFNNENLEPKATNIPRLGTRKGYYSFEKFYLSPFTNHDVNNFIDKKYGVIRLFDSKKVKAKEIVRNSPYLMARPMLLDFIEDIVDSEKDFNYTFYIYEALIDSWLERETFNVSRNKKFTYKSDLLKFSTEISKIIYNGRKQLGYTISQTKFEEIARKNNLELSSFEMRVRSLLNRNPEGSYKFSHKSILEFFLAKEIYKDWFFKKHFDEEGMDMTMNFYDELCFINDYLPFVRSGKFKSQVEIFKDDKSMGNLLYKNDLLKVNKLIVENYIENDLRALRCFKNIEVLIIKNSQIETLNDINSFQNLRELKIKDSKVKEFNSISSLNLLTNLSLINLNLFDYQRNEIYWKELINLISLDLSRNSITNIDEIDKANNIKILNISKNNISNISIPSYIEVIDLSCNKFTEIDLGNTKLNKLTASSNQIGKFKLNKNKSLTSIDLSNNPINSIVFDDQNLVKFLYLANCNLNDETIKSVKPCKSLNKLNVSENNLSELNFTKSLNELEIINISNTLIEKIKTKDLPVSINEILLSKNIDVVNETGISFEKNEKGNLFKKNNNRRS